MGLDMYLTASRSVGKYSSANTTDAVDGIESGFPELKTIKEGDQLAYNVSSEVMYWRKANAIHQWFVDNVQDGVDDCRPSYVSRDMLNELIDTCETVLADTSKAHELLPTASGVFFGTTEYDERYFDSLEYTASKLKHILKTMPDEWVFQYRASW
jgi:hypothetical protein